MFGIETMFRKQSKHFLELYNVFCQGMALSRNIFKIYEDEFAFH